MLRLLSFIGAVVIKLLGRTLRITETCSATCGENYHRHDQGRNVVFAFWHGEQFPLCYHHRDENVVIMSSLSRDGEIQTGILQRLGFAIVRGSSTRGGERALVETIRRVKQGHSAAFAVDGPRGPSHEIKPGVIYLAQKTGRPIVPVSTASRRATLFSKAWDKYELPSPFTRTVVCYGATIAVGKDASIEEKRKELQQSMDRLSRFAHDAYWSGDVCRYLEQHPRPKILIVQPSRIGDVVFSLPSVTAIRKKYPHAWIGWMVDERCAPILEGTTCIDEVIVFDRRRISFDYLRTTRRYLHDRHIDVSIDFHGLAKSALMVWLAGAKFRIGSSSTNGMRELSWLFSKEIPPGKEKAHCVERHLAVAHYLGADTSTVDYGLSVSDADARKIDGLFTEHGIVAGKPLVVVHPGGGWVSRRWFPERFAALIDRLMKEKQAQVILVGGREGGSSELGLNDEITAKVDGKIVDFTGMLSLRELGALLSRCSVFVGNEAGPMHLATALGVPSVAIVGPTDPGRTGPYGGKTRIIQKKVPCQPCRERNCGTVECMQRVSVDEVFAAVVDRMENKHSEVSGG